MKRIALQANDFAELLNSNRGKSIEALDGRMQEMGTMGFEHLYSCRKMFWK